MTIEEISAKLNKIAIDNKRPFGSLQEVRAKHGIKPRTWSPFASFSVKDEYAFHAGGRKELQFNIGEDFVNGIDVFRYGVAFSLYQDKTLHNSKAEFRPIINRFNQFFIDNKNVFKNFSCWYYSNHKFAEFFDEVREIDDDLFQADRFIFIGKYFEKQIQDITLNDLHEVLDTFDNLMPLYELAQFGILDFEKRLARICWNDNGWIMPSGTFGKSVNPDTHEAKYGYGHEEWLFDIGKLIAGYHYGFLEPIRKQQNAYENNTYNVWLYTIDGDTKKRYWIGEINCIEVLNKEDAELAKAEYIKRGWFQEMENQIKASGANPKGFSDWKGVDLFNIRYIPTNLKLNDPYFEIPKEHPINDQSRYSFAHFKEEFSLEISALNDFTFKFSGDEEFSQDIEKGIPKSETRIREPKTIEITHLHKAMSEALTHELRKIYGIKNVQREHSAGYGANKIDIVVRKDEELIFYEIKSYACLRTSIREAIGQLMEYALWTNSKKSNKLIVVTQPLDGFENARVYFKHLRDTFNLPLYYQSFDLQKNVLSEIV